jgi:hypothetical protein
MELKNNPLFFNEILRFIKNKNLLIFMSLYYTMWQE